MMVMIQEPGAPSCFHLLVIAAWLLLRSIVLVSRVIVAWLLLHSIALVSIVV